MSCRGWQAFWDSGGWWKAVLAAAAYLVLYQLIGFLGGFLPGAAKSVDDALSSTTNVLLDVALPPALGSVILVIFARSVGWLPRPLFGRQPVSGPRWMWIGPVLVAVAAIGHFVGSDYSRFTGSVIVAILVVGLVVGLSEELITRGIAVTLLRRGGHREWFVMFGSALIFALLHLSNIFAGMPVSTVLATVVYTFGFGINMYLALRAGGRLLWPILLHAMTDPSTLLASGGIDHAVTTTSNLPLLIGTIATFGYGAFAVVGLIAVRGDAQGRAEADEPARLDKPTEQN